MSSDLTTDGPGIDLRRLSVLDAQRLLAIAYTFARHGTATVVYKGPYVALRPRRQTEQAVARAVRRSLADLGPTFIKLGQLVSSSPGLFPESLAEECRLLLDRLPPERFDRVRHVIETDLGASIGEIFSSFDEVPIAAASIAQVHRANLMDGTPVAVKVRRPRLRSRVASDVRLMRLLAALLQHAGTVGRLANPVAVVEDFATTLEAELDFRNEAEAMRQFSAALAQDSSDDLVFAPMPVPGMVSSKVLIMEFVDGIPIDDEPGVRSQHDHPEVLLQAAVRAWVRVALRHGIFHGDVHAGNLLVTPSGRVAFLDFGIVGRLGDDSRATLQTLLTALLLEQDYPKAVGALFALGAVGEPDPSAAAEELRSIVEPLLAAPLSEIRYAEILGQILQVAGTFRVQLPRDFVLVAKQLLYFERYGRRLAPDYQLLADPEIIGYLLGTDPEATAAIRESR